jgi:hypothetical protein
LCKPIEDVRIKTMKRLAILIILALLPLQQSSAAEPELLGVIPSVVDGNTQVATFELTLPTTVILNSNTKVEWGNSQPAFTNEVGDEYVPQTGIWASSPPITVKISPIGRRATFNVSSALAVTASFTFFAKIDNKYYSTTKSIRFQKSTNIDVYRIDLPPLPKGFSIEVDNPDPGLDEQTVIRARAIWTEAKKLDIGFNWLTYNGSVVERLGSNSPANGEWRQIPVTVDAYSRTGFVLGVAWSFATSSDPWASTLIFQRKIPLTIPFKAKPKAEKDFSWSFTDGKSGPVSVYNFTQGGIAAGNIAVTAVIDWANIDKNVECIEAKWLLQFQVGTKWVLDGDDTDYSEMNYGLVCRRPTVTKLSDSLIVSSRDKSGNWLKGSRNYRIWSEFQQKSVANFKVLYTPDLYASSVKVSFPDIVQYGKTYTVTATVTPKYNGTCTFYTYYLGDIPVGKSKIINGKASFTFRILWPRSTNANDTTRSIMARCAGGKYSSSGGKLFLGTGN